MKCITPLILVASTVFPLGAALATAPTPPSVRAVWPKTAPAHLDGVAPDGVVPVVINTVPSSMAAIQVFVNVTAADGSVVDGTLQPIQGADGPIHDLRHLWLWRPAARLESDATYDMTFFGAFEDSATPRMSFTTTSTDAPTAIEAPVVAEQTTLGFQSGAQGPYLCCSIEGVVDCAASVVDPFPEVSFEVASSDAFTITRVEYSDPLLTHWLLPGETSVTLPLDRSRGYCVDLVSERVDSRAVSAVNRFCPDVPDEAEWPEFIPPVETACAGRPLVDPPTPSEPPQGCSTHANGSAHGLGAVAFFLMLMTLVRRRATRSTRAILL